MSSEKLDKIPDTILSHMNSIVSEGTTDANTPLEAVLRMQKPKKSPKKSKLPPVIDKDGFYLYDDPTTLMFYELLKLENPDVDRILAKAQFVMTDLNGKPLFPRPVVSQPLCPPTLPS